MDDELKPCPFCGGEALANLTKIDNETTFAGVNCKQCNCQILAGNTKQEAITFWNDRPLCPDTLEAAAINDLIEAITPIHKQIMDEEYDPKGGDDESIGASDKGPLPRTFGQIRALDMAIRNLKGET